MSKLLIATNNKGKVDELRDLLKDIGIDLLTPAQINLQLDVAEDGKTYAENATKKAIAFAQASGLISLADDSGIEVDALDGAPGLYSARWGGDGLDDAARNALLLARLRDVPTPRRTARYRCVIAVVDPDRRERVVEGTCEGVIAEAPRGA